MNFTICITDRCNLRCSYCYEDKHDNTMDNITIKKTISFMERVLVHNQNNTRVSINIQGGEAFLELNILKALLLGINKSNISSKIKYISMTTNGTVYNEEIKNIIKENNIALSVSVDGNKKNHDKFRYFSDGKGSYDKVMENIRNIISDGIDIRCRMTYDSDSLEGISEGISELVSKGVKIFALAFNPFDENWSYRHNEILKSEIRKIKGIIEKNKDVRISLYDNIENFLCEKGDCFSGVNSFAINPKGNIYSCIYTLGDETYLLGNIDQDIETIAKISRKMHHDMFLEEKGTECSCCSIREFCDGFRCKIINKKASGFSYKPQYITCGNYSTFFELHKETING